MEQNKGFWYADWSFPIFVGLLSAGVFAGTHMYYLYGIGAFNEVAFVAMLKAGIDTGAYGAVAAFGASFLFARIIEGSLVGILDIGGAIQTGVGLGVPALLLGAGFVFPVANFAASLVTGLVLGLAIGYIIILARKFTINQSDSTYGADVMMGAGNASGRFLGPLIILSAMTASIPIGIGSLAGALLFYIDTLLGLNESFATIVLAISIVVGICTYPLVNALVRRFGKKPLLLAACAAYVAIYLGIYFHAPISQAISTAPLGPGFLASLAGEGAMVGDVAAAILIGVCVAFPIACTNILPPSAFADMAQYDRIKTGEDRAGMFVAARQFVTKLSQAGVTAIVSYTMYLGSADSYPTHDGVRMTALIAAVCLVFAVIVYAFYNDKEVVSFIDDWNDKQRAAEKA